MTMTRLLRAVAGALLAAGLLMAPAAAQLSPEERADIEDVVRNYILQNPEIIIEAVELYQQREEQMESERQERAVSELSDQLFNSDSPTIGAENPEVILVEFMDYNCGYCRRSLDDVTTLVETDDGLQVVFKEIPILGPSSITAARAALAAREQGLYFDLHNAFMSHSGTLTDEVIYQIAEQVGADMDRLRADMESEAVASELASNMELARAIGVRGTPAFVVGDQVIPGAVGIDALRDAIEAAREAG
jgi:protein-disulfide isomerase